MSGRKKGRGKKRRKASDTARDERQVELLPDHDTSSSPTPDAGAVPNDRQEAAAATSLGGAAVADAVAEEPPRGDATPPPPAAPAPSPAAEARAGSAPEAGTRARPAGNQLARARDLVEQGRVHEAIDLYGEILAENPDSLKAHNNLGVLFDGLKQHDRATQHFEEALRVDPEHVEVLTNYGSALTSLARYEDADGLLRRALRLAPDDLEARLALGVLTFRRGLYVQCESDLRWVCEQDPGSGLAFYYRAEALNRVGRFEEASQLMERAAELLPDDPRPFYTLGHLYDRKSLPEAAAEMYRRARALQVS